MMNALSLWQMTDGVAAGWWECMAAVAIGFGAFCLPILQRGVYALNRYIHGLALNYLLLHL